MGELDGEQLAGGLWCHQVLENLDAWVDGSLPSDVHEMAQAHLRVCDRCTRFGGAYAAVVTRLRTGLLQDSPEQAIVGRLDARLQADLEER